VPVTWAEHRFRAMGTTVDLLVDGPVGLATWAEEEIERLEYLWSRFRADSDVSRCNAAGGSATTVAGETIEVLERALHLWAETGARFDPTVLRSLEAHGYDETFERVRERPTDSGCSRLVIRPPGRHPLELVVSVDPTTTGPTPGCSAIVIDSTRRTVLLPDGVGLDLGGIGKGYAADIVARDLIARGAVGACISMGGDVRCAGVSPVAGGWDIEIEDPFDPQRTLFTRRLTDSAIVTSTRLFRRWLHGGRWQHHLIDPSTGAPADRRVAAVIVADREAWRAEGWAKAAFVSGSIEGVELLDRGGLAGWIVDDDGVVVASAVAAAEARDEVA
jgi:FAD:protein FMN transferase